MGLLYRKGRGVARDYAKAREWCQKAANAGDATAKQTLSRLSYRQFTDTTAGKRRPRLITKFAFVPYVLLLFSFLFPFDGTYRGLQILTFEVEMRDLALWRENAFFGRLGKHHPDRRYVLLDRLPPSKQRQKTWPLLF